MTRGDAYRPIADYAIIGDSHTAALVGTDGSIDWCCLPHFDSPAVFCRLLDAEKGGWFRVGPAGKYSASRSYVGMTNVLATTFTTDTGRLRVTDLMPVERRAQHRRGQDVATCHNILRLVECLSGEVELEVSFRPTFDFARARADFGYFEGGVVAGAGDERLTLTCPVRLTSDGRGAAAGRETLAAGRRLWVELKYGSGGVEGGAEGRDADEALGRTLDYWKEWEAACTYSGPYHELVRRSALTLKLLTFEPTGAVIAAPTTSLPESVGGVRNWDYRFTWLRDSALILDALMSVGYHDEALDFFDWVEGLCSGGGRLQIMYTVGGSTDLPEQTLDHLEGYRGSRPVRVGNAAAGQAQLDIYGEVLDATRLCLERMPRPVGPELRGTIELLARQAAARWREPDSGIWEVRGGPRHYLYSKLLCWVALDRAVRLSGRAGLEGEAPGWLRTRDEIRRAILTEGYDEEAGAFTQAFGEKALDASALAVPLVGFLPATDPRVRSTVERVSERLTSHGLVYRYLSDDGLPGSEATFALCSFWLVDNLALQGRVDEARELFERLAGYASDTGLFAEMIDPHSGELLGNYPQGFTHLALIRSALKIARAESRAAAGEAPRLA
jgi:alpha,alpha-trehalase